MRKKLSLIVIVCFLAMVFFTASAIATEDEDDWALSVGLAGWALIHGGPYYQEGSLVGPSLAISKGRWTFAASFITGQVENELGPGYGFLGSDIGAQNPDDRYYVSYDYDRSDLDLLVKYYLGKTDFLNTSFALLVGFKYHDYSGTEEWFSASDDFKRDITQKHIGGGAGIGISIPVGNPNTTPLSIDGAINGLIMKVDSSMTDYNGDDYDTDTTGYGTNGYIGLTLQLFENAYISAGYRGQWMSAGDYQESSISDSWYPIGETCGGIYVAGGYTFYF